MEDKISIKINIADRYYPLIVEAFEEEGIRKAAKMINEKINLYKQRYAQKDIQDFLAMAALQYVSRVIDLENQRENVLIKELEDINHEICEYVKSENTTV